MRYRLFVLTTICTLLAAQGRAQQLVNPKGCAQADKTKELWKEFPEYEQYGQLAETSVNHWLANNKERNALKDGETYVIPIVFHVIYNTDETNISDEQVRSGVAYMNEVYNKENGDSTRIAEAFQDVHVPWNFEFRLATIDPNGNCTNGIMRYYDPDADKLDESFKAGKQWPAESYLNIYVGSGLASDGVAGYAYLPGTAPDSRDGIVIGHNFVGTTGTSNRSSTATLVHEVGHYLGLNHPWGGSNDPELASNCNTDDGVGDTPNTEGGRSCIINRTTCGSLDNVQNFMDYSGCGFEMFTEGQRDRCIGFFTTDARRRNLVSAANIEAVGADYARGVKPDLLCKADFDILGQGIICSGDSVVFQDRSYFDVTGWNWTFEGGQPASSTDQNPTVIFSEPGLYEATLTVSRSGQSQTVAKSLVRVIENAYEVPFTEQCESATMLDAEDGQFRVDDVDGDNRTWQHYENAGFEDGSCLRIRSRFVFGETTDHLESNPITIENLEVPTLEFAYAHAYRSPTNQSDRLTVSVTEDCGNSYQVQTILTRSFFKTADPVSTGEFIPTEDTDWRTRTLDLSAFKGKTIRLRFTYEHRGGNNVYLDKFRIAEAQTIGINSSSGALASLEVWPNPFSENFYVSGVDQDKVANIRVTDVLGKDIAFQKSSGGKGLFITIDAPKTGLYFVQISLEDGTTKTVRVLAK